MEALGNDTGRALRWQLLRAPLDEGLLGGLVREYCAVRGLPCDALDAAAAGPSGPAHGSHAGDAASAHSSRSVGAVLLPVVRAMRTCCAR